MKNFSFSKLTAFLLLFIFCSGIVYAGEKRHIVILHTNDIHGMVFPVFYKTYGEKGAELGGLAHLATKIDQMRKLYPHQVLLLDAGDCSQGTPVSNFFFGAPVTDYFNFTKYDAGTLGNHEFDWDTSKMVEQIKRRNFPIVCCNIFDKNTGKLVDYVKPYTIVERNGMKIGLIGVDTPECHRVCAPKHISNLDFVDPAVEINKHAATLTKMGVKIIGVISHIGYDEDKALTKRLKNVDFIVGGHSHTPVFKPTMVNGIVVVQAGSWGKYLGFADLYIDKDAGKVTAFKAKLLPILSKEIKPNLELQKVLQGYQDKVKDIMAEKLGDLDSDLQNTLFQNSGDTAVGRVMTDIVRDIAKADIAIYNTHGLRAPLKKGVLTKGDLFVVMPFDNMLETYDIPGTKLYELLEYYVDRPSYTQFSGVTLKYDSKMKPGSRLIDVKINGEPIDTAKTYKIASIDFLIGVSKQDCEAIKGVQENVCGNVRDLTEEYIKALKAPIVLPEENRITVINPTTGDRHKQH